MWILTPEGFFSTTESSLDPDAIQVRARDKQHLTYLMERVNDEVEILDNPERDYQYRVIIHRDKFQEWMTKIVNTLDYSNFKNTAQKFQDQKNGFGEGDDKYLHLLHEIWYLGFRALGKNWYEYNNVA